MPTSLLVSHKNCSLRMEWLEAGSIPFPSCRAQAGSSSQRLHPLLSHRLNLPHQGQPGGLQAIGRMSSYSLGGRTSARIMGLSRWIRLKRPTVLSRPRLPLSGLVNQDQVGSPQLLPQFVRDSLDQPTNLLPSPQGPVCSPSPMLVPVDNHSTTQDRVSGLLTTQ